MSGPGPQHYIRAQGRPLTERELFGWLRDNLGEARDAARGLAHARKDPRWLQLAQLLDACRDKTNKLMNDSRALHIFRVP